MVEPRWGLLEIVSEGPTASQTRIILDGHEVHNLISFELKIQDGKMNEAVLVIHPDSIEIDTQTLINLQAIAVIKEIQNGT